MTHELDISCWYENPGNERDHACSDPTDSEAGETAADWISSWLEENNISLPRDAKYLALAAGQAYPELRFASELSIDPAEITLVDRQFQSAAQNRFKMEYPEVSVIESGMFEFLENPPVADFSLVTALGVEYALEEPKAAETFISLLPSVMRNRGIVTVFPYTGEDPSAWWENHGFQPLFKQYTTYDGTASTLIYLFNGNSSGSKF